MSKTRSAAKAAIRAAYDRVLAIDDQTKGLYQEKDRLEAQIIVAIQASADGQMPLDDGRVLMVKDNFCDASGRPRNVAFKTAAIRRFEVVAT